MPGSDAATGGIWIDPAARSGGLGGLGGMSDRHLSPFNGPGGIYHDSEAAEGGYGYNGVRSGEPGSFFGTPGTFGMSPEELGGRSPHGFNAMPADQATAPGTHGLSRGLSRGLNEMYGIEVAQEIEQALGTAAYHSPTPSPPVDTTAMSRDPFSKAALDAAFQSAVPTTNPPDTWGIELGPTPYGPFSAFQDPVNFTGHPSVSVGRTSFGMNMPGMPVNQPTSISPFGFTATNTTPPGMRSPSFGVGPLGIDPFGISRSTNPPAAFAAAVNQVSTTLGVSRAVAASMVSQSISAPGASGRGGDMSAAGGSDGGGHGPSGHGGVGNFGGGHAPGDSNADQQGGSSQGGRGGLGGTHGGVGVGGTYGGGWGGSYGADGSYGGNSDSGMGGVGGVGGMGVGGAGWGGGSNEGNSNSGR
jgi:hypothetical protein